MKTLKKVKVDDPEALDHIARCEIYQAISDYEIWRRILLKDPEDREAYQMMEDCEEFILTDPYHPLALACTTAQAPRPGPC